VLVPRQGLENGRLAVVAGLTPYIHFPGTARGALSFYAEVFGGTAELHSFGDFGRSDGPADAVAHGLLVDAPVALYGADVAGDEPAFRAEGLMLSRDRYGLHWLIGFETADA
jgi:hypothetical protein